MKNRLDIAHGRGRSRPARKGPVPSRGASQLPNAPWSARVLAAIVLAGSSLFPCHAAQEPIAHASAAPAQALPGALIAKPRPASDLLLTDEGRKFTGALLNESISLRTAYATLRLPKAAIARIDLADPRQGLDSVETVNSNRFTGFLDDPSLTFRSDTGDVVKVRTEKVAEVILGSSHKEIPASGIWIYLKNGDRLSGELLTETLNLRTANTELKIARNDLTALLMTADGSSGATVLLRNGTVLNGTLATEEARIKLDLGQTVTLYRGRLRSISQTRDLPAGALKPVLEAGLPGDQTGPGASTNREGLIWIPAGEFIMGSPSDEPGRDWDEGPQTRVVIAHGFWMGKCEVTQAEFQRVMGYNPSNEAGPPNRPVEKVSWYEAIDYCTRLTRGEETAGRLPDGYSYRLPTEAEWEYACRAGTTTRFSFGDDPAEVHLGEYAWYAGNSDSTSHPVGTRRPNPWGLYDMHGNVWEWCLDRWPGSLPGGTITNRPALAQGTLRTTRGGSWLYDSRACRSANRDDYSPGDRCSDIGFRIVLAPLEP